VVTRRDYNELQVQAARSVLIELMHVLGEYRKDIVLVGGWVPQFLCPDPDKPHVGSLDIDLALDHRSLREAGYRTIQQLRIARGYRQGGQPHVFFREIERQGMRIRVEVDLLAGEYEGSGKGRRHQRMQDVMARKARGCDLVFEAPVEILLEEDLPSEGRGRVRIRVAAIAPFLVMKGMALEDRLKEKDAWDVYYCVSNYPGGLEELIREIKPLMRNALAREGFRKIAKHFASIESVGPKAVADFEEIIDTDARQQIQRDAYERVNYVLEQLD